jgi:hypothetical protein
MNKIILVIPAFLALTLVSTNGAPKISAHTAAYELGVSMGFATRKSWRQDEYSDGHILRRLYGSAYTISQISTDLSSPIRNRYLYTIIET